MLCACIKRKGQDMPAAILSCTPHKTLQHHYAVGVHIPLEEGFDCVVRRVYGDESSPLCSYQDGAWSIQYVTTCSPYLHYPDDIASMYYFLFVRERNCMTYSLTITLRSDGSVTTVASGFEVSTHRGGMYV